MTAEKEPQVVVDDNPELPIDVDILTADPEKKTEAKPAKEAALEKEDPDHEAIASLKRQLDEERAKSTREADRAAAAERQAREFESHATIASNKTLRSQLDSVESALHLTKTQAEQAEREYAAAMEIADYTAAAKAQRVMGRADSDITRLEQGKRQLEHYIRQEQNRPQPRQSAPDVSEYIDGIREASSPKARAYIDRVRTNLGDVKAVNRLVAAHEFAVNNDIAPDSDDYFAFLDRQMGWQQDEPSQQQTRRTTEQRSYSAPVSRDTAKANGDLSGRTITLTADQARIADELGVSRTAYAKNMMKIRSNGKDPSADGLRFSSDMKH